MIFATALLFALSSFAAAVPLSPRAELAVQPACSNKAPLDSHDCNVALLSLGGGIQGAIQSLKVDSNTNTATSGTCAMTVTTTDPNATISITKGRLEQAFKAMNAECKLAPATVTSVGGATSGDLNIEIAAA